MSKSFIIGKKSEKNEIELKNHKKQLFLNKKRKNNSEDSSPMNSSYQILSNNSKQKNNFYLEQCNSQKQAFRSNFLKDMDHEIIEISESEEPKQNSIKFINLQLEQDNKFSSSKKFNGIIKLDSDSNSESDENEESKEFFQKIVKNIKISENDIINMSSPVINRPNLSYEKIGTSFVPLIKDSNGREKLKKDLGIDSLDEFSSSSIKCERNGNQNFNNNLKTDMNNVFSSAFHFPNKDKNFHSDLILKNNYNNNEDIRNLVKISEKPKDNKFFMKDFIEFSKKEEYKNFIEFEKEETNILNKNSLQNYDSNSDSIENINSIPIPIQIDNFPWLSEKTKPLRGILKLHHEILNFYEFIKPTSEEDRLRDITVRKLKNLIKLEFPDWKVKKFGSFPNKIHLPDSDVDIVILPIESESTHNQLKILKKIRRILIDEDCVDYIKLIEARVPIIRATLKETKINIDISANRKNGYEAKKVIKKTLEDFPCMRPLIYVLKYFLRQRKLNESYTGGISSFLLFNLLLSYIQYVVKNENKLENNFSTSIEINSNLTLGHLLVGFLQFFAFDFNFEEVGISVKYGGYFYKKSERGWLDSKRNWLLSVENFQDTEQDIGKSSFKFKKVLDCFKQARDALYYPSTYPIESYLGHFINVDKFIIERAQKLKIYNEKLK